MKNILNINILFKIFFVFISLIFYLYFKTYFQTGMGGDDSKIYMFYPNVFYDKVSSNLRFSQFEGSNPQTFYINTTYILSFLNKIGATPNDLYFLIFYISFIFTYKTLKIITINVFKKTFKNSFFLLIISLIYPINILNLSFIVDNHYSSIFSILATPILFFVFFRILFNRLKFFEILILSLYLTSISVYFGTLIFPFVNVIILLAFFILYIIYNIKDLKFIIKNFILLVFSFSIINLNWLYDLANPRNQESRTFSAFENFYLDLSNHLDFYRSIKLIYNLFLSNINLNDATNTLVNSLFLLFTALIVYSIYNLLKNNNKIDRSTFYPYIFIFFIAGFLQTISLTKIGSLIFLKMSEILNVLYTLRNFPNKVSPTFSLIVLVVISLSYYRNLTIEYSKYLKYFIVSVTLFYLYISVITFNSYNFKEIKTTDLISSEKFPPEFFELVEYINNQKYERISYLPISEAYSSAISNSNKNDIYIGISPIWVFTGTDDINGYFLTEKIIKNNLLDYKNSINKSLITEDIESYKKIMMYLGSEAIVTNEKIDPEILYKHPWYKDYGINYNNIFSELKKNKNQDFKSSNGMFYVYKLDSKIISFKDKISTINAINKNLSIDKNTLYLKKNEYLNVNNFQMPKNVSVNKIDNNGYKINLELEDSSRPIILQLSKLNDERWTLDGQNIKKQTKVNSKELFNWWVIFPDSEKLNLTLIYEDKFRVYLNNLSKFSLIISLVYVIINYTIILFNKKISDKNN